MNFLLPKSHAAFQNKSDAVMLQYCHNSKLLTFFAGIHNFIHFWHFLLLVAIFSAAGISVLRADSIAFFYAIDVDLDATKDKDSGNARSVKLLGSNIQEFQVGPHKVRAVKMGAGNVETAVNAANLLGKFPADLAISIGPCGALCDEARRGTWYRVSSVIGYQRGTFSPSGWSQSEEAVLSVPPLPASASVPGLPASSPAMPDIKLASGDIFVANDAERERIRVMSNAEVVDMNSYGLLLVCDKAKIPVLIWKVVSDEANPSTPEDFKVFIKSYDGEGGRMVRRFLLEMKPSPLSPESYENIREMMQHPQSSFTPEVTLQPGR